MLNDVGLQGVTYSNDVQGLRSGRQRGFNGRTVKKEGKWRWSGDGVRWTQVVADQKPPEAT